MTTNYAIFTNDRLLHDYDDQSETRFIIDTLVASGDCFVTLATQLDAVSESLPPGQVGRESLEAVVTVLMDLQRHYAIVKKQPNYRQ